MSTVKRPKTATALADLHAFVQKQAQEASGVAGAETKPQRTPAPAIDKNSVKPETDTPKVEQKKNDHAANPLKTAAESLGEEILGEIKQAQEASGVAGAETKPQRTPVSPIDKNSVKPETDTPKVEQKKNDHAANPLKTASVLEAAEKVARFNLGRQVAAALLQGQTKQASAADMVKAAGRRDFELLIAQAAQNLELQKAAAAEAAYLEKAAAEAEILGEFEATFQLKSAALDESIELLDKLAAENADLRTRLASFEKAAAEAAAKEVELKKAASENALVDKIIARLKETSAGA